nr:hypothetical protein [Tanacetum cinerariifolium]
YVYLNTYHTPSPKAQQTSPTGTSSPSLPPITTATIPTVIPSDTPQLRQYTRRARIAQSSALPPIADEPASPIGDDSQGEACLTDSGLEAEQDRENITKTSTLPSNSTPRVTSLTADEGNMQQKLNELTDLVRLLEDREGGGIAQSGEDSLIKGRSLDEGEEAAIERSTEKGSNNTEEMVNVLTSLDATTILSSGVSVSISPVIEVFVAEVPTGSGSIPTPSPPGTRVPTGVVPTESETPKKKKIQEQMDMQMARQLEEEMERDAQRMNEQIARDAEIARIHAEEELQIMIDGLDRNNETVAKYLQEYYQFATELPIEERIELIKESERFKIKGLRLEQDSAKKVKILEEVSEENLKDMMQLVPIEEVYVEALQVKHPIIDWEVHTEGERSYWKIIRLGGSTTNYQFFVDILKHFDREDLNQLWELVKETLNIRQAVNDKEKELWVELKRLYEPDVEDQLWTHT